MPPGTPPPEKKPPAKPTAAKPVKTPETAAPARQQWSLEGVGSLKIDLEHTGDAVTFQSLGSEARLDLTIVNRPRLDALALALALGVALVGIALTNRPAGRKVLYVLAVGLVATLVPVVTGRIELALAVNASFYAACLLVPYYLVVGVVRWCVRQGRRVAGALAPAATVLVAAAWLVSAWAGAPAPAGAAEPPSPDRVVVEVIEAGPPPKVPEDALILPFDPESKTGVRDAEKVLVPYARYVELWNLANPDARLEAPKPPAPYALAGARYAAALAGDEFLLLEGSLDVDVYTDEYASVPLPLAGGVLAKADLDGKPARLQVAQPMPAAVKQKAEKPAPPAGGLVVLHVSGKGRHRLDVAVRLRLDRRGGWRVAEGRVPAAAATALALRVPQAQTEVRLGGVLDRQTYETKAADEAIQTALGPDGALSVQWRPKVSEGQVDQSLTASSTAVLDVEEDRLRLAWSLVLEFRRSERDFFSLEIPAGYLVEKVEGTNVRGWEVRPPAAGEAGSPRLEVALLKRAKDQESLTVSLWRPMVTPAGEAARIDAPVLGVVGALLHSGQITVRRSPLLDVQTVETSGVTRTDLPPPAPGPAAVVDESPLGIRPYQAFRFATAPFAITMTATPVALHATARVQTILKVAEREVGLESRAILSVRGRPLHRVRLVVPADLRLDQVSAPGGFEWAVTEEGGRRILTVYLAAGCQGDVPVIVRGVLGEPPAAEAQAGPREKIAAVDLPRIEVLDVAEQQGDLVVQTDPAFEVRAEGLRNLDRAFLAAMAEWLSGAQRQRAKLALHYTNPDYAGRLALVAKPPDVTCHTVTNVRVTDRALEEAVLLDFSVREAGVREVAFLLPWWMKDARVSVPLLRQKTVERAGQGDEAPWRVRLELQDEVMGQLRVLVENDRLLTESVQRAPVPVVETGRTDRRYVALESAGRDEVVVARREGLEPLGRQQKEWETVAALFRGGTTQAYLVSADAKDPILEFRTRERAAVETARARIGLAQTLFVLDAEGAYRARQVYHMDNRTEQFLEIDLPEGADLWTARVAGEAVKPAVVPAAAGRIVRIPLVKTAAGDLDYAVVLKYGGKLPRLHSLRRVDFPLARTRNVNVELSQVELYLPETHAWFDFDSKMTPVTEEGDLEAGVVAYQTRMTERLVQAIRSSDNPFAKARAVANYGQFKEQITLYQDSSVSQYRANKKVEQELAANSAMLREADQQVQTSAEAPEQIVFYNNDTIRQHFERQKNVRARNVVTDLGPNWADADIPAQPQGQVTVTDGRFNDKWLEANRLENLELKKEGAAKAQSRVQIPTPTTPQARSQRRGGQGQPAAPEVARGKAKEMLQQETQQEQQQFAPSQGGQQAQAAEDLAFRYQQKLQQRAQRDKEVAQETAKSVEGLTTVAGVRGDAVHGVQGAGHPGYYAGAVETGGGLFGGGGGAGGEPAGMASLDVELPARGTLYRFTMPRAEIDIAARPVSQPLIDSLIRIGGVIVALAVLALGWRFWKRGGLPPAARPAAALIFIVLGLAGFLFGVFPVPSFVVLVAAVVWRVRLAIEHRRAAMAA